MCENEQNHDSSNSNDNQEFQDLNDLPPQHHDEEPIGKGFGRDRKPNTEPSDKEE